MPNPKLETYKNKATGTVYDYTDAAAQAALADILDGTDIDSFSDVETALATKVDKVTGKGLSTNDYDDTEKAKVAGAFPRSEQAVLGAKNIGKYVNQSLVGDSTAGFNLVSGGSSLIAKLEHNKDYIVKRKSGQGDRFRVVLFINAPSVMSPDTSASQAVFDNTKDEYTISSGNYNYAVFTYVSSSSTAISQDTAEAMISFDGGEYAPYAMTNRELTEKVQGIIDAATNAADFAAFKTAIGNL